MKNLIAILLLCVVSMYLVPAQAQITPGGVTAPKVEYWLRADDITKTTTKDGEDITVWEDLSVNQRHVFSVSKHRPRLIKSSMNFNAAVDFYTTEGVGAEQNDALRKLVSLDKFKFDSNRSYYTIMVSDFTNQEGLLYSSAFSIEKQLGLGWGSNAGNKKYVYLFKDGSILRDLLIAKGMTYGITNIMWPNLPSGGGTNYRRMLYFNGEKSIANFPTGVDFDNSGGVAVIGNKSPLATVSEQPFTGQVMEVIVFSEPKTATKVGKYMSDNDRSRVESYLSIKYGIALHNSIKRFILSDNTLVLNLADAAFNGYQSDVFGLARDDASGLYQKQAKSAANSVLSVSIGEFAASNLENTGVLQNKQALMFAATGNMGKSTYSHPSGTKFKNYTLKASIDPLTGKDNGEKVNTLFNYKLKAKITGAQYFTVNTLVGMGEWLLVSSNANFTPSQTNIYKVKGGQVQGVRLNDGDYIGFTSFLRAPAGVSNSLAMWLNASIFESLSIEESTGEIVNWVDYSGYGVNYRKYSGNTAAPLYVKADPRANFHPSPLFRSAQDYLITDKTPMSVVDPRSIEDPDNYPDPKFVGVYAVVNHDFSTNTANFLSFGSHTPVTKSQRPSFGIYRNGTSPSTDGRARMQASSTVNSSGKLFNVGATTIAGYHWSVGTNIAYEFDANLQAPTLYNQKNYVMNGAGMLGLGGSSTANMLKGVMPEVIMYERILTAQEKAKVNSYLGLKYGVTLKNGTQKFNYVLSDNFSVWNGTTAAFSKFHNNVAALVRDDVGNLYNQQSKSTDLGAIVHMGVGSKLGPSPELDDILQDKVALVWGHNGGSTSGIAFGNNANICGDMDMKIGTRIWMVQNTKFEPEVLLRADSPNFIFKGADKQVYLLIADTEAKLANNQWDRMVPMSFVDGAHQVNYKFAKDQKTYFTFSSKGIPGGGCETCDFEGVKTLSFDQTSWPMGVKNKTFDLGDGFSADVKVSIEGNGEFLNQYYPRASNLQSLRQMRGKGNGSNKMITQVDLKQDGQAIAAATTFEVFEVDRLGTSVTNVEVYGMCSGKKILPTLSNTTTNSTYEITDNKAQGIKSSSYTDARGRMLVSFDRPVDQIFVVHTYTGASSSLMRIGIGPMEFNCSAQPPAPNIEGLIFTKKGPTTASLCDEITYSFSITNTSCNAITTTFSDILPSGMKWVAESLMATQQDLAAATVNTYGQTNNLNIQNLIIKGGATISFKARAVFDLDANAGTYQNRAKLAYKNAANQNVELLSSDYLSSSAAATSTLVTGDPSQRALDLEVVSFAIQEVCYKENSEVFVEMKVNNPNNFAYTDMVLEMIFNEEFKFKNDPSSYSISALGSLVSMDSSTAGVLSLRAGNLPVGETTISFTLLTPQLADIVFDNASTPKAIPLEVSFDWSTESNDTCISASVNGLFGEFSIEYCSACYYQAKQGDPGDILASNGFMAISSLNRSDRSWIGARGNAFLVMESKSKGFVITRLSSVQIQALDPIVGMLVYDTTKNKLVMYDGVQWGEMEQGCVDDF